MSLLKYTSNEMFSSTELIRKSKTVFDKIHYEDIEKAVILRDGKPSFILMDFAKYEALINEYLKLKDSVKLQKKSSEKKEEKPNKIEIVNETERVEVQNTSKKEIDKNEFQKALEEIDNLDINSKVEPKEIKKEALKDFWD